MKKLVVLFLVVAAVVPLFANGQGETAKGPSIPEIRFAYNWTGTATSKEVEFEGRLFQYQKDHAAEVKMVYETAPDMTLQNKIKVDLAADDLPDVFLYWGGMSNVGDMIEYGRLLDVESFCKESSVLKKEYWPDSTFMDSTVDGKAYMFPISTFKWFPIYNKALFDKFGLEIPTTYEELKKCAEVFKANDIVTIGVGSLGGEYGHVYYCQILYQLAGGVADTRDLNKDYQFESPATLRAAEYVAEMKSLGMFPADTIAQGGSSQATALYTQSKCAMILCAPWLLDTIDSDVLATSVIADFPRLPDATVDPATFNQGSVSQGLCIAKESFEDPAKKEQIIKFVDYILSDETFYILARTNDLPAKTVVVDESELHPWIAKSIAATNGQETYQPLWFLLPTTETSTAYLDGIDELFAGAVTPATFVKNVQAAFDASRP